MRGVGTAAAVAVAVLSVACAPTETAEQMQRRMEQETAAFREVLGEMEAKYERYENAGQADSVAMLYTENAVAAFPNQPALRGREAIREGAAAFYALGTATLDIRNESAMASGSLGIERGTYVQQFAPGPNAPAGMAAMYPDSGNYLAHWHLVNGEWKLAELVVSSMRPPPGMGM